jgi:predicted MFS family arabinose efflux permease
MSRFSPRILGPLAFAVFVGTWNITFLAPLLPDVADSADVSVTAAGQMVTVSAVFTVLALIALGPLSDRYGPRAMLTAGLAVMAAAAFGSALTSSYPLLLGLRVLAGVADALILPTAVAAVADYYEAKDREVAVNLLIVPAGAAGVIGLPAVVAIAAVFDWHASFATFGVLILGSLLLTQLLPAADVRRRRRDLGRHYRESYGAVLNNRPALLVLLASVLSAAVWYGVVTYAGAFFEEELDAGSTMLGALFGGLGAAYIVGGALGVLAARRASPRSIAIFSAVCAASLVLPAITLSALPALTIALALAFAASRGPAQAALANMLIELTPSAAGTAISLYAVVAATGLVVGAASGGGGIAVLDYTGMAAVFTVLAALSALILVSPRVAPVARLEVPA